jgi:hypothetical protein
MYQDLDESDRTYSKRRPPNESKLIAIATMPSTTMMMPDTTTRTRTMIMMMTPRSTIAPQGKTKHSPTLLVLLKWRRRRGPAEHCNRVSYAIYGTVATVRSSTSALGLSLSALVFHHDVSTGLDGPGRSDDPPSTIDRLKSVLIVFYLRKKTLSNQPS